MLGALSIYVELGRPGVYLPGLAGVALLGWGSYELAQLPVSVGAVLLIGAGLAMFLVEVYRSTRLIATALGTALLCFGASHLAPGLSGLFVIGLCIAFGAVTALLATSARAARINKRRDLGTEFDRSA